jgi:uncharacterized caspase-like protein
MSSFLERTGFTVDATTGTNRKDLARRIDRFAKQLRPGDVALFYYSGHGIQIDGENYRIPVDFGGEDETESRLITVQFFESEIL